jgi:hypothetical protein
MHLVQLDRYPVVRVDKISDTNDTISIDCRDDAFSTIVSSRYVIAVS